MAKKENTEEKIIEAAREVFHKKGYDGTRMQEIADQANINKGLLHYYFKSKDKLFTKVFSIAFDTIFSRIGKILNSDQPLFEKIENFCHTYVEMVSHNSYVPRFVLHELGKNPDAFVEKVVARGNQPHLQKWNEQVLEAIDKGHIRPVDPGHLIINMLSLCVFPFIARPIFQLMMEMDNDQFENLIQERKAEVTAFVIHAIQQ